MNIYTKLMLTIVMIYFFSYGSDIILWPSIDYAKRKAS